MLKKWNMFKHYLDFEDVLIKPKFSDIEFDEIDISIAISKNIVLKIPVIASPMDTVCGADMAIAIGKLGGLGIIHRNQTIEAQVAEVKKSLNQNIPVGAAIGLADDFKKRVDELIKTGVNIVCIDYAIGHSKCEIEAIKYIKNKYDVEVMAGNVITEKAIKDYFKIGVRLFRFGSGSGSICISRSVTGVGIPQFSALLDVKSLAEKEKICVVADGGIRTGGDIVKALAAGAGAVMLGSMLAGTKESPGELINVGGKSCKQYRGMGSSASMKKGSSDRYNQQSSNIFHPEGIEKNIEYKGDVKNIIEDIIYGIKSGMLRVGAKNITCLRKKAEFIEVSSFSKK